MSPSLPSLIPDICRATAVTVYKGEAQAWTKEKLPARAGVGSITKTVPCIGAASTPEAGHLVSQDAGGELPASGKGLG